MQAEIIDRGRGPEIKGTRITVCDVMDYEREGWHHTQIAALFRISSNQVIAALEYIEAHRDEVEAVYQEILARHARHAPPKVFTAARDTTAALTEATLKVEREIDERVAGLYGL